MQAIEIGFVQLELKYCERCGSLWLRFCGSDVPYCGACVRAIAGLPQWQGGERASDSGALPGESLAGAFWAEGGNA